MKKICSPISIPNFPKIPKIILRKLWDEARHTSSVISKKKTIFPQNGPNQGFLAVAISQTVSCVTPPAATASVLPVGWKDLPVRFRMCCSDFYRKPRLVECAVVISVVSPVNGNALYGCVISVANRRVECVHHAGCNSVCVSPTTMPGASADGCRTRKLLRFEWCYSQRLNMPRTEVRDDLRFLKLCKIINRF